MEGTDREPYFPEPEVPDLEWGTYSSTMDQAGWLDRSTLPRAIRIRGFLNRSLGELPAQAADGLAHRLRHDPPSQRVYFELVVGRFLRVLGATVDHQPIGLGGVNVDWRAMFPSGDVIYVEATSPAYNQHANLERRRLEALIAVVEEAMPDGWWVHPKHLPKLGLSDSRTVFKRIVHQLLSDLPDPSDYSIETKLRREGGTGRERVVLELWPAKSGKPRGSPIAFASMGAYADDSSLRVGVAARTKRHQARAFPGETVLLAIDAPFGGPDVEDFDVALFGSTVMHVGIHRGITGYSFRRNGALATQRHAEYAAVLAFPRVHLFGATDPIIYHHRGSKGPFRRSCATFGTASSKRTRSEMSLRGGPGSSTRSGSRST